MNAHFNKCFYITAIPFGCYMILVFSQRFSFLSALFSGIFAGLFFGVLMSIAFQIFYKITTGKNTANIGRDSFEKISLALPFDKAFELCLKSVSAIKNGKIKNQSSTSNEIIVRLGVSAKSWGNLVKYKLTKINDNTTLVEVHSRSLLFTTIIDYGKNREHIKSIISFLGSNVDIRDSSATV